MMPFSPLGLYVHVPFCASACSFCAFYQEKPKRAALDAYLAGMELELDRLSVTRPFSTIFWGGGTPGLLPAEDLLRLGEAVLKKIDKAYLLEWTVEVAPSVIKPDKLAVLKALGVTRLSMGVQSFQLDLLEKLGRRHGPQQVYQAYEWARAAGFDNINLDLMFALPGQTFETWEQDLLAAMALKPEHISTYCLTFEEDTPLYLKLMRGETQKRTPDEEADYYLKTWDILEQHGYAQYEISNFSKPGRECLHNIHTWEMAEWIGVGPSAASQYARQRYQNIASIDDWLKGLHQGKPHLVDFQEIAGDSFWMDYLIFGLRMNRGVDKLLLYNKIDSPKVIASLNALWNMLEENGLLTRDESRVCLTPQGRLVVDNIAGLILDIVVELECGRCCSSLTY